MKAVQVGILVLLVVVAGLLLMIYRGQTTKPAAVPEATQPAAAPEAAQPAAEGAPGVETPPAAAPAAPAPASSPTRTVRQKPSPAPQRRSEPEAVSQARPADTSPAGAPAAAPAGEQQVSQPTPSAPARVPLTPPSGTPSSPPAPVAPHKVTVPAGTLLTVRLTEAISSEKNKPGDTFTASLDQPLIVEGFILAERGARVEGRVLEVEQAGRIRGLASLKIHLVRLHTSDGQDVAIHTEPFAKTSEVSKTDDAKKIGVGAAIGAAIGAIAGGGRGAAIGAGVGGAAGTGTVMATRGKPAVLPSETRLSFRLQEPVTLVEKIK